MDKRPDCLETSHVFQVLEHPQSGIARTLTWTEVTGVQHKTEIQTSEGLQPPSDLQGDLIWIGTL